MSSSPFLEKLNHFLMTIVYSICKGSVSFYILVVTIGSGLVSPRKLLGPIEFNLRGLPRTTSNSVRFTMKMGEWAALPGIGMPKNIRAEVIDPGGKVKERLKFEPAEELLLNVSGVSMSQPVEDLAPLTEYTVRGSLTLGPVIGTLESASTFTTKVPKKKKKKKRD